MEVRPSGSAWSGPKLQPPRPEDKPRSADSALPSDLGNVDMVDWSAEALSVPPVAESERASKPQAPASDLSLRVTKAEQDQIHRQIAELRRRIASGEYVTEDKIDVVVQRLYEELLRDPPAGPAAE